MQALTAEDAADGIQGFRRFARWRARRAKDHIFSQAIVSGGACDRRSYRHPSAGADWNDSGLSA
jgi:hypothetical protein